MSNVMSNCADAAVKQQGEWIFETIRVDGPDSQLGDESIAPEDDRLHSESVTESDDGSDGATSESIASQHFPGAREEFVLPMKVAAIQAAIASGTYNVPASAVAAKIVDAMMGGRK